MKQTIHTLTGRIQQFFGNLSIARKLIFMMLGLICLFTASITFYYYSVSATMIHSNSERRLISTMRQTIGNLDSRIRVLESILYDTSTSVYLQEILQDIRQDGSHADDSSWETSEKIRNFLMLEGTKLDEVRGFSVFDAAGREYSVQNLRYDFHSIEIDWEMLDAGKGSTVWGHPQKSGVLFGPEDAPLVIPVGKPIYSLATHKVLGYVIAFLDVEYLRSVTDELFLSKGESIFLMMADGTVLSEHIPEDMKQLPFPEESFISCQYGGTSRRIGKWPSQYGVWNLMMVAQDASRNPELLDFQRTTLILLLGSVTLAVFLCILMARGISRPILSLAKDMQQFSGGDFTLRVSALYQDEVGTLRRTFNQLAAEIDRLINDVYHEKLLKQQAQLRMLQMQINPHFLYNTLDTIHWLALSHQAEDVADVARSLGYLMHFSLSEQEMISIEEELDAADHYMKIQRYRYGDQLDARIQVEEDVLYEKIPRHVILPLIENAVEHGLKNKSGRKQICISGQVAEGRICLQIHDNGTGMSEEAIRQALNGDSVRQQETGRHMSIGLRNVSQRLRLRYGKQGLLKIHSSASEGTTVFLEIPCQTEDTNGGEQE